MSTAELDRASRASRGKRMSKLLDEEAEADDEFWNQDAFNDDGEDNEYATEDEEADVFDSDFDEDEPDEEEGDVEDEREPKAKKRKLPPGTKKEKKKEKKSDKKKKKEKKERKEKEKKERKEEPSAPKEVGVSFATPDRGGDISQSGTIPSNLSQSSQQQENGEPMQDGDGERSIRKSTRTAVVIKQAEREAFQAAQQALSKPVKKKKEEERKITQEEMLLEAAQTEIQNVQTLEIMLAREEEVKRKATVQKTLYAGPQIRFVSRDGKNVLEFTKVNRFPLPLNSGPTPQPKKVLCVITGLPAKYRDPKSGLPYATKEAFKIIRERFNKRENQRNRDPLEESHQRKRTKVEREKSGTGGRRAVTKLKYKNVTNVIGTDDAAKSTEPDVQIIEQTMEPVQTMEPPQTLEPALEDSVGLNYNSGLMAIKSGVDSLQLSGSLLTHDLSSLDMPEAFVETNEEDFMLDDLIVSTPPTLA